MTAKQTQRQQLLETAMAMSAARLNVGSAGNTSVRLNIAGDCLITPSGFAPEACRPEDMVVLHHDGQASGNYAPSSEWRLHRDLYAERPEVGAIVHAHAPFATALACQRRGIPPFHYMIARFGGTDVRCAAYATFGTQALSDQALVGLQQRHACLLANHGMVALGYDSAHALALAIELEMLCEQYWRTLQLGVPVLLLPHEMEEVLQGFGGYGRPQQAPSNGHKP